MAITVNGTMLKNATLGTTLVTKADVEQAFADLGVVLKFVGISTTDPTKGATVAGVDTFEAGNVCFWGKKEFVATVAEGVVTWVEIGDEGSYALKSWVEEQLALKAVASEVTAALDKKADKTTVEALDTRVGDNETAIEGLGTRIDEIVAVGGEPNVYDKIEIGGVTLPSAADSDGNLIGKFSFTVDNATTGVTTTLTDGAVKVNFDLSKYATDDELDTAVEDLQGKIDTKAATTYVNEELAKKVNIEEGKALLANTDKAKYDGYAAQIATKAEAKALTDGLAKKVNIEAGKSLLADTDKAKYDGYEATINSKVTAEEGKGLLANTDKAKYDGYAAQISGVDAKADANAAKMAAVVAALPKFTVTDATTAKDMADAIAAIIAAIKATPAA